MIVGILKRCHRDRHSGKPRRFKPNKVSEQLKKLINESAVSIFKVVDVNVLSLSDFNQLIFF